MRTYPLERGLIVTSPYGPRQGEFHTGVDFGYPGGSAGRPVHAVQAGTVIYAGAAQGYGGPDPAGWLVIDSDDGQGGGCVEYGHIVREVELGAHVLAGQRIAHINPDSRTNGGVAPHLHLSVMPRAYDPATKRDPISWLGAATYPGEGTVAMGDPIWLPEVLRSAGLTVHEYPGWRDRGHGDFGSIWGVVCHHTGSFAETARGIAEHPDLGLASQLYLAPDGTYTVCGVGIAWHAGVGSWPGLPRDDANRLTIGIEAANDGGGRPGLPHRHGWSDAQYDAYVTGVAAILRHLGVPASHAIGHKEWAGDEQGKWDPGAIDMDIFRADVARVIDGGRVAPTGGDDDVISKEDVDRIADRVVEKLMGHRPPQPDGSTDATVGELLTWIDKHAGDGVDAEYGEGARDKRENLSK